MKKKTAAQPLSGNTKMALIITAIVVLAAIILTIVLVEILKPIERTPAADDPNNGGSSSLTIKNGDFAYADSSATSYPQLAQNWTRYGAPTGENSTSLVAIEDSSKALMGIIDTDDEKWDEVKSDLGMNDLVNPKTHDDTLDSKVYMIASKEATSASILSDQFSVPSNTSVKITVWLKTSGLKAGSKAVIMLSQSTTDARESNWYAYDFDITAQEGEADDNGWICKEFYLFNRYSSSRSVRCSVGLGNVYDKELSETQRNAEGVLFVDDIAFETVTANEYRIYADGGLEDDHSYKIIENTDSEKKEVEFKELAGEGIEIKNTYASYDQYMENYVGSVKNAETGKYDLSEYKLAAPFTQKDDFVEVKEGETPFTIYEIANDGTNHGSVGLRLKQNLTVQTSDVDKDHHHFSFWVRVDQNNSLCDINVVLQKWDAAANEYKEIEALISNDSTSQDTAEDTNNGWKKYDIYIKPSSTETEISILITLGAVDGYLESDRYVPDGTMFVTSPSYELIPQKDYTNASSGTTTKKVNLVGVSASMDVTNGSFNDSATAVKSQPASWTPVFAGQNAIYKDGKGDEEFMKDLDTTAAATLGTGLVRDASLAPKYSDPEHSILKLVNNTATSQGYLSSNITLSAKSVYAISVLAKAEGSAKPYIYLINNNFERAKAVVAKITAVAQKPVDDSTFGQLDVNGDGWFRYYIIVVTGSESQTVRLGLFNGSIDGADKPANATVYYDNADMVRIGTYTLEKPEDEKAALMDLTYADESGKYTAFDKLELADVDNVVTLEPTEEEWKEIRAIPEENEDDNNNDDNNNTENPEETQPVDLGLLFSVLSSVLLLAALLIVVVVRVYRNKNKKQQ